MDTFDDNDKDEDVTNSITNQLKRFRRTIPTLFSTILAGTEQLPDLSTNTIERIQQITSSKESVRFKPLDTKYYRNLQVIGKVKNDIIRTVKLSTKEFEMDKKFRKELGEAYIHNYTEAITIIGTTQ